MQVNRLLPAILLAYLPCFLLAQTTTGLNYQAVLRNSAYAAISNQSGTAVVSILNGSTELYREFHTINTDILGLFNLIIGKGTALNGNFATLDWGSSGRSVKVVVSVGGNTYDFAPTELQAVPYAKIAERSLQPGPVGPKGEKGDKGDTGAQGPTGSTGAAGAKGDKGDTGATGPAGAKGDKGDTGVQGPSGSTGAAGAKGDKGDVGATGAAGAKGDKGDPGTQGPTGSIGATGAKGDKGDVGAKGDKGDIGAAGTPGAKGDKGDKGDPGNSNWTPIGVNIFNNNTGSVLIGHTAISPNAYSSKLDVKGTVAFSAEADLTLNVYNTSANQGGALQGVSSTGIGGAFYGGTYGIYAKHTGLGGGTGIVGLSESYTGIAGNTQTGRAVFGYATTTGTAGHFEANSGMGGYFTSNTGAAIITGLGNVGIGTSSPTQKLSVNGSVGLKGQITITSNTSNDASNIFQDNKNLSINNPQLGNIILYSANGPSYLSIGNNRQTGLNTLNPAATLHISQNCCGQTSLLLTGNNTGETANDGARITIDNGGNEPIMKIVNAESGIMQLINGANGGVQLFGASFIPIVDNSTDLGRGNARWRTVWSANGTVQTSDARLKKNIQNLNYGLATVLKMRPVSYQWKDTSLSQQNNLGFIAQEMAQLVPEVVINEKDTYGIKYADLIPVLTKAIQEQQVAIEALKKENEALRSKTAQATNHLDALGQKIAKLEALLLPGKTN